MTKGMAGEFMVPAKSLFMFCHPAHNVIGMTGATGIPLGGKKPVNRFVEGKPVLSQDIRSSL